MTITNLQMNLSWAAGYVSPSQIAKILTERWVAEESYCPSCLNSLTNAQANAAVLDFSCHSCNADFELKSKKGAWGKKITDGAYGSMISRLNAPSSPHFLFLNYSSNYKVDGLIAVPAYFIQPSCIERRKPLSLNARRAGWVGCNILSEKIPELGKITLIKNSIVVPSSRVRQQWGRISFLGQVKKAEARGWTLDILKCIENLVSESFTLSQLYAFEDTLAIKHPNNKHIKEKIRQQLQILRDKNVIEFISPGKYKYRRII
jgi:type II restriction enzyme